AADISTSGAVSRDGGMNVAEVEETENQNHSIDITHSADVATVPTGDTSVVPKGIAVVNEGSRSGTLNLRDIPAIASTQDYQLWGVDASGKNFSIGLLEVQGGAGRVAFDLAPEEPLPAKLVITVEPAGGSDQPG